MNSLEALYEHLVQHLITKIPTIQFIDLWNNQTSFEEKEISFNLPAVFIELATITAQRLGNKRYAALVSINLHVVSDHLLDTDSDAEANIRAESLEHLRLMDQLLYHLDGHSDNSVGFNAMGWTSTEADTGRGSIVVHVMSFETRLVVDAAKRPLVTINPPLPSLEIIPDITN